MKLMLGLYFVFFGYLAHANKSDQQIACDIALSKFQASALILGSSIRSTPEYECYVEISFFSPDSIITFIEDRIADGRHSSKENINVNGNELSVNLHLNNPFIIYPPVLDGNGNPYPDDQTLDECNYNKRRVLDNALAVDLAKYITAKVKTGLRGGVWGNGLRNHCYLDLEFSDSQSLVAFLKWHKNNVRDDLSSLWTYRSSTGVLIQ